MLEASMFVTNGIPLGLPLPLTITTVKSVQTLKVSVFQVMKDAGKAINDTFRQSVVEQVDVTGPCVEGQVVLTLPADGEFDYVMTCEDLVYGARVGNYSVDYQAVGGSTWETLVPVVVPNATALGDRPDGHDPRDSHIGHKRIDLPVVQTSGGAAVKIAKVRLNCIAAYEEPVYIKSFSLHKKTVPWE
jgi:hypothetical protein